MTNKHIKVISFISAFLVLVIAIFAFILSFSAIRQLAIDATVPVNIAFMVPLIVDGLMAVLSVSILRAYLMNEDTRLNWFFVCVFTAVSIGFNYAHSDKSIPGIAIAILTPIALVIAFESFMKQIRQSVQYKTTIQGIEHLKIELKALINEKTKSENRVERIEAHAENRKQLLNAEIDKLKGQIKKLKAEKTTVKMKPEIVAMRVIIQNNSSVSKSEIGRMIGVAPSTVGNYAEKIGALKNGAGWKMK